MALRFDNIDESPIGHRQLLTCRRYDDLDRDLWTLFNRVQENLIRGGLSGIRRRNEDGVMILNSKPRTMRGIRSGDRSIELNADLWRLADSFARMH